MVRKPEGGEGKNGGGRGLEKAGGLKDQKTRGHLPLAHCVTSLVGDLGTIFAEAVESSLRHRGADSGYLEVFVLHKRKYGKPSASWNNECDIVIFVLLTRKDLTTDTTQCYRSSGQGACAHAVRPFQPHVLEVKACFALLEGGCAVLPFRLAA